MIEKRKFMVATLNQNLVTFGVQYCLLSFPMTLQIQTTNRQHDTSCCQNAVTIGTHFFWFES